MSNKITITKNDGTKEQIECIAGQTSDGYHTFDELYDHRCLLFCMISAGIAGWKSRKHHDGSEWEGWFIAGCNLYIKE